MTDTHGSFIWYELMTKDPGGAKRFYEAVIGWDIEAEPSGDMDYRMVNAADGPVAGVMRLTDEMVADGGRPIWMGYVAVDDVDAAVAAFEAEGGSTHMPATDIQGIGRIAMAADPQGVPIYVMKPIPPAGDTDATSTAFAPGRDGHIAWNELTAPDQDQAIAFYTAQFGWSQEGAMPMPGMGDYKFIHHGGVNFGAVMPDASGRLAMWKFCFKVASIDDAMAAIDAGGGKVIHGPNEVPGGHVVGATDPEGVEFMVIGAKTA